MSVGVSASGQDGSLRVRWRHTSPVRRERRPTQGRKLGVATPCNKLEYLV